MATYNFYESSSNDIIWKLGGDKYVGLCGVGRSALGYEEEGAVRFVNVTIPQAKTITSAILHLKITSKGSSPVSLRITGIDVDNVSDFNTDPFVLSQTTASENFEASLGSVGDFQNFSVTSQVQEIVNRGSWASGNAMGFHLWSNETSDGYFVRNGSLTDYLEVTYDEPSPSLSVSRSPSTTPSPSFLPPERRVTLRVSLDGYNAETDHNPDHFSLYTDEDWVLIKEKTRGSVNINASSTETITHNLGYVPFFAVYADNKYVTGYNIYSDFKAYATTTTLVMINNSASQKTFKYYIFYDQQV